MSQHQKSVALVTGGRRGIGFGIAKRLAADGHDLVICDIAEANEVKDAVAELERLGAAVLYARCDISKAEDRAAMLGAVKTRFGRLDHLVNNAGVAPLSRDDILVASEESFERLIRINVQGPYFLTQAVANWMVEQKKADPAFRGTITFVSSMSATVVSVNRGEYCISKAGVAMAAKLWAVRMAEYDVLVYEIRPGIIETPMTAGVKEKYDRLFAQGIAPQKRWGQPEDIGKVVAMLARGDLPYSTGQTIMVDGGFTVQTL
jgi:3-oxoacyl-[acyl-carrier protein] reductase